MNKNYVPTKIRELTRKNAPEFYKLSKPTPPSEIKAGQVWSTLKQFTFGSHNYVAKIPRLVVILAVRKYHIAVAPLSLDVEMACEYDLIVRHETKVLPFDCMIEVWNQTPALHEQLHKYINTLSKETLTNLLDLYIAYLTQDEISEMLKKHVGVPIVETLDQRKMFQQDEVDALLYLAEPATLAVHLQTSSEEAKTKVSQQTIVSLKYIWGKLTDYLSDSQEKYPRVAFADSSSAAELSKHIFYAINDEKQFVTTIRVKKTSVQLTLHEVGDSLRGNTVFIRLRSDSDMLGHIKVNDLQPSQVIEISANVKQVQAITSIDVQVIEDN